MIFSHLCHRQPTRRQLHQAVVYGGDTLTVQALDKRFTPAAEQFLLALLSEALRQQVDPSEAVTSLLTHFSAVYVLDATVLASGDKLLTRLNLNDGHMTLQLAPAIQHDNRIRLAHATLPAGSLRLTDLGFFDLDAFAQVEQQHGFWLSRYKARTALLCPQTGRRLDLAQLLSPAQSLYCPVLVGVRQHLPAYLVARPVAPDQLQARQQRRRYRAQRKQQPVAPATLALAGWDVYLTNIPDLSVEAICALAHARWQIEVVFKVWKSFWGLSAWPSIDPVRQRCWLYAKLLALWLAHSLCMLDPHPNRSWWYAAQTIRDHALLVLSALASPERWQACLALLRARLPLTSRLSKRNAPARTFQLLVLRP